MYVRLCNSNHHFEWSFESVILCIFFIFSFEYYLFVSVVLVSFMLFCFFVFFYEIRLFQFRYELSSFNLHCV